MRTHEKRRCLKCGHTMQVVDGSDRTVKQRVWFSLRCPCCGHMELDWYERSRPVGGRTLNNH